MPPSHSSPAASPDRVAVAVLVGALALVGAVSAWAGVHFAVTRSQDFQWSGERLLLQHIDPWQTFLSGDPGHRLIATQIPNYLPILYVLLAPIGFMAEHAANLIWALVNLLFAVTSAVVAARFYGLRGQLWTVGITAAMLAATPTRNSISNGQQCLLILVLWTVALLWPPPGPHSLPLEQRPGNGALLLIGISYLKYSFAPAIAIYLLLRDGLRHGIRMLLWTFVPAVLSTVTVWLWIRQPHDFRHLAQQFLSPLQVSKSGYQPTGDGGQTLMDLLEFLLGGGPVARPRLTLISFAVAVAITAAVLLLALRFIRRTGQTNNVQCFGWLVALTATMSFVLYKHHPYDEVVFLYPLCYLIRQWRRPAAAIGLLLIAYNWYVSRFVDGRMPWTLAWAGVRVVMFLLLLAAVYWAKPRTSHASDTNPDTTANNSPAHAGSLA